MGTQVASGNDVPTTKHGTTKQGRQMGSYRLKSVLQYISIYIS